MTTVADVNLGAWYKQSATPTRDGLYPLAFRPLGTGMPIGIPIPFTGTVSWDDATPTRPSTWTSDSAGYYYINAQTGTDTARTYGNPTAPRRTIPSPVPAGSYIEVEDDFDILNGGVIPIMEEFLSSQDSQQQLLLFL